MVTYHQTPIFECSVYNICLKDIALSAHIFVHYFRFNSQHDWVWGVYDQLFCLHLRFDNGRIIQISPKKYEEYGYSLDLDLVIILY